ncbi:type III secretion protein HrpF [Salinicola avicenniae]|uniref:type III secretion protein HrpF n=1 Tax=Salinicola avicenniae TaxID=2916836 RepID=UPI002072C562|nr:MULTISPECIES: type III secretion protein HrpF [unclassified Salinicola]
MASISADQRHMDNRFEHAMKEISKAALTSTGSPEDMAQFSNLVQQASGIQYAVTNNAKYNHNLATKIIDSMP